MLEFVEVAKSFHPPEGPWVLAGLSARIPDSSVTAVIGANGSGKSTLLRLAGGFDSPTRGRVARDRPLGRFSFLPDRAVLDPVLWLNDYRHLVARRLFDEVVEALDLRGFLRSRLGRLSAGQRRRCEVGLSVAMGEGLCLLDEPFAGVDPSQCERILEYLLVAAARGRTILFTDHQDRARFRGRVAQIFLDEVTAVEGSRGS